MLPRSEELSTFSPDQSSGANKPVVDLDAYGLMAEGAWASGVRPPFALTIWQVILFTALFRCTIIPFGVVTMEDL